MAINTHDVGERADTAEKERELDAIDSLIARCKSRLSSVSEGLMSSATKSATADMYAQLRSEAENDELRGERLQWMRDNVWLLQETIAKAAREREWFETDLSQAVRQKWMSTESAARWMRRFEDPSMLEMYRSAWLRTEWQGFKERWKSLGKDRSLVLARAAQRGLRAADVPELAKISSDDAFLADGLSYHERRSLVDAADAAITAVGTGKTVELRKAEALLLPASKGAGRYLHPAKVGQWMKRVAESANPAAFRATVIAPFMKNWKAARDRYDALERRFGDDGKPDGCAPMGVNAFLQGTYEARLTTLNEWEARLDAAKRLREEESNELETAKAEVRRAVDLHDLDVAEERLSLLRARHPDDADVRTIGAHLAMLRDAARKEEERKEEGERTQQAIEELQALQEGVPTVLAKHYEFVLKNGNAEQAAAFFLSMKVRADRHKSGQTTDDEEFRSSMIAEDVEEAALVAAVEERGEGGVIDGEAAVEHVVETENAVMMQEEEPGEEQPAESDVATTNETTGGHEELLVTKDTPPSRTLALLGARGSARPDRSPALVVEGLPYEQQVQLVELNARALAHMRHLESMGKPYGNAQKDLKVA